jgi:hypothetical protein
MFQRIFKNPVSLISFFIITLAYLLVHFIGCKTSLSGLDFFLYLIIFLSGIGYARKTLLLWFSDLTVALTLLALAFGTNLFYMVTLDYQLQPILLFSLYAMAVFLSAKWHEQPTQTYAVLLALGLGMIILLQPTGMFSLLIPVLWGVHDKASWKSKLLLIRNNVRQFCIFIACLAVLVLPPVLFWKISPGDIPVLSFKLPGMFYSFSTWLWNDLFSFDHGWLIYTPIMVFALTGFYLISDKFRPFFYSLFFLFFIELFMESSWSLLGETPVFGQVAFVPFYAILSIPFAAATDFIMGRRSPYRFAFFLVTVILVLFNFFQTYQYSNGIILPEKMTSRYWSMAFGRTHLSEWEKETDPCYEVQASVVLKDTEGFTRKTLAFYDFEDTTAIYRNALAKDTSASGHRSFRLNPSTRFSPGIKVQYSKVTLKSRVGIRIAVSILLRKPITEGDLNLVITSSHNGNYYHYRALSLKSQNIRPGSWKTFSFDYLSPKNVDRSDEFQANVWYTGNDVVFIDNLRIELFEPLN